MRFLKLHFSLMVFLIFWQSNCFASKYFCEEKLVRENTCFDLIKLNSAAALGECLPVGQPKDALALLKRNNISGNIGLIPKDLRPRRNNNLSARNIKSLENLEDPRMLALIRVVSALDKIGDGSLSVLKNNSKGIKVIFQGPGSTSGNSRRHGNQIQLAEGNQNQQGMLGHSTCGGVDNIGLITHEIGHYVGGGNNREVYNAYQLQVRRLGACRLSQYANDQNDKGDFTEEFAEVFAAYVTHPEAFIDKGANCRRAFNFMKNLFGEPDMTMSCEARKASYKATSKFPAGHSEKLLRRFPFQKPKKAIRFSPDRYNKRGRDPLDEKTFPFNYKTGEPIH